MQKATIEFPLKFGRDLRPSFRALADRFVAPVSIVRACYRWDIVKEQAQTGQMGDQLFAVVFKRRIEERTRAGRLRVRWVRGYRAPRREDDDASKLSELLASRAPDWEARDINPTETIPERSKPSY